MTFSRAVILSLVIHVLLGLCLSLIQTPVKSPASETYLELLDKNPAGRKADKKFKKDKEQIVRAAPLPEELKTKEKKKARFLSEDDQTVLEETRAAASGLTANRATNSDSTDPSHNPEQRKPVPQPRKPPHDLAKNHAKTKPKSNRFSKFLPEKSPLEGEIAVGGLQKAPVQPDPEDGSRPLPLPNFPGLAFERGQSTQGDELPSDIKFGNFTALNTDRYLYYTFYARVEEMVRHRWVKYVRAVLFSYQNTNPKAGSESWSTRIEIVLDKDGNFVKGVLHDGSGLRGLDIAPVQAFREAKQIPNPPTEMIKDDGRIHLDYQFNVHFIPQAIAEQ